MKAETFSRRRSADYHSVSFVLCFYVIFLVRKGWQFGINAFVIVGAIDSSSSATPATCSSCKMSTMTKLSAVETLSTIPDLDEDTRQFHQYAAAAVDLSLAHVSAQSVLSVVRSVRNWETNTRRNYLYRINLAPALTESGSTETLSESMMLPPIPLDPSVQMFLPSPSGQKTIVVRKEHQNDNDCQIVEVWEGSLLKRRVEVGGKTSHGNIINDPAGFGMPSWSPDEKHLLYSAERRPPSTSPFWSKIKDDRGKHKIGGQNVEGQGQTESWGETYHNQEAILDLYILNLSTGQLGRVWNVPKTFDQETPQSSVSEKEKASSVTFGQGVWHPTASRIAVTGWSAGQPKRLGMVYCKNRASQIYEIDVGSLIEELGETSIDEKEEQKKNKSEASCKSDVNYTRISSDLFFARSPRYIGESLVFLSSSHAFVSHDACMALYRWDKEEESSFVVVPTIENPSPNGAKVSGLGFPGLYLSQLPINCDIDGNYLVTTTLWGSFQRVIRVNVENGDVHLIHIPQMNELGSQSLCTVSANGDLVISEASCDQPASLWTVKKQDVLQANKADSGRIEVDAYRITSFFPIAASTFSDVQPTTDLPYDMQVMSLESNSIDGAPSTSIQALLLLPKNKDQKVPMIVVPHGGPHGCSTSAFAPGIAFLASKYAVLLPNYRGSTGFGQAPLKSLLTRIGRVDVDDVMLCTRHTIENFSVVDSKRIGICGGSHGGFLTAHCTSQYPEFFKAAAMRNPVTNIASMITSTDIPDWCFGEVMGEYDQSLFRGPTSEQIVKMYEKSPMSLVHRVKTPTLLALGSVDLRVPPSQGLEWYHSLRSLGVPTKLLKYPQDCHSLNLVTTEVDHWMHIRHWFDEYFR